MPDNQRSKVLLAGEPADVFDATVDESAQLRAQILALTARYAEVAHAPKPFVAGQSAVPVSGRVYGGSDMMALVDSALDFWLTAGRFNDMFEKRLAANLGVRFALTCNSGSSANLLAATALTSHLLGDRALKSGDEVITCATGFPTTVNPLIQSGLVPVFLDVDIPTYNIRADLIEAAVNDRTRAIMVAHTLGNPFDLDTVMAVAKKHDLFVIEDSCDALGATYDGRSVGSFGDIGTLSFYPAHHITMGEGGAVFGNSTTMKRILESVRDWGRDCWCDPGFDNTCKKRFDWDLGNLPHGYDHKYTYSHLGYNLKITDMQAAIGLAQLDKLDGFIARRRANFADLKAGLAAYEEIFILPEATLKSNPSWFGFPITMRDHAPFARDTLLKHLNDKKIGTRLLFGGNLVRQPYMDGRNYRIHGSLDASDKVMRDTFWIGVYPGIEKPAIEYVIETIRRFCAARG
jgi:CDP-6-deoxy-D-xylo-4-hexulose-3-dehydrase